MDNFTLFVIIADVAMGLAFVALIVLDKPAKAAPLEPVKPTGRKSS